MIDVFLCYTLAGAGALIGLVLTKLIAPGIELDVDVRRALWLYRAGFSALVPLLAFAWVPPAARRDAADVLLALAATGAACLGWALRTLYGSRHSALLEGGFALGCGLLFALACQAPPARSAWASNAVFATIGLGLLSGLVRLHWRRSSLMASGWAQLVVAVLFTGIFAAGLVDTLRVPRIAYEVHDLYLPAALLPVGAASLTLLPLTISALGLAVINERLVGRLRELALSDELTGLPARRGFQEMAPLLLGEQRRQGRATAVLMFDIDHFKRVNDTHGHPVGDETLRGFGAEVRRHLRADALLARTGGEEFTALVPVATRADAVTAAERARAATEAAAFDTAAGPLKLTVSIGVAMVGEGGLAVALKAADDALYAAKHGGRNQVRGAWAADEA